MAKDPEQTMLEARAHCTVIAASLAQVVGPTHAAGLLLGGALGILVTHFGRDEAVRQLRELAADVEKDDGSDQAHSSRVN